MDQNFQTSFIPKKPLAEERVVRTRPVNIFNLIAGVLFFCAIVLALGTFFYKYTLTKSVADKARQLEASRGRFEPDTILDLKNLDKRLSASNEILSSHIIVSPIFESLQDQTLKSVGYTKFKYEITKDKIQRVIVTMSGKASGYNAIALQSDEFSIKNKYIKDPVFSNLNRDDKGRIGFDLTFDIDPTFVNFKDTLSRISATIVNPTSLDMGNNEEPPIDNPNPNGEENN